DVEADYRPAEERAIDAARDPIKRLGELLIEAELATAADLKKLRDEVDREISEAADRALAIPQPAKETAMLYIYSPDVDPTAKEFDTEEQTKVPPGEGTMVDLINRCLHEEMARNPRIVVLGEDVADASRTEYLSQVKGKGGVFKITANLQRKF